MAGYRATARGERFTFRSLAHVLAAATPARSGDELAGIAAGSALERVAARRVLMDLPLTAFLSEAVVPYERDEVTRLIIDSHDRTAFAPFAAMTLGDLRDWLLSPAATAVSLGAAAPGFTPEMVAAVSKLMRNQDLVRVARKAEVITAFRNTLGRKGTLATRLQPNHPADDPKGIAVAVLDGLAFGAGDAVIGINPASDNIANCHGLLCALDDIRARFDIPGQTCVLTHVTNALDLLEAGAPVDLIFQSVAGTEAANAGFGVSLSVLREAHEAGLAAGRGTVGRNVMYFETGQGAALSADAHHGVDQQTLEARAYGVARAFDPMIVNTVVGFIGPEYLYDGKQIIRAGLEDHFCGKLLGLPMGVDVCYTNHVQADQDDMDTLATLLVAAGVNFLITVPGADDAMLGYQSLAFEDIAYLREISGLAPAPEFAAWLAETGIGGRAQALPDPARLLEKMGLGT
ncbi:ethanolamine ammonia-lyase subunit EutB [Celeribacter indicus]|uniref:Ethanolamine ammonia-lyase large subunit n=1 Tax=Celeribacter indicus TaxID=1208324 RepID=A0A0B5E5D0_9RHOB|nr:ethanolamine ammonia-lyase subunit EutB [Celeribacter indicus]AJE47562.1 ethanolamine ammonia lyase large subunit [Celeribacter indicus]SDW10271.1 Ethanolamine ammonia-lyase heavy chain [Celeribacter indicus]